MFSELIIGRIEAYFQRVTGQHAFFVPSGRFGIYLSLCELFSPGQRIIVSPVTDDFVLFAVLAAGLKPIFIDIDPNTGGFYPDKIKEAAAIGARGVLTTNLYGIPENMPAIQKACDDNGLVLIEDCAHAMGSTVGGKLIGQFGEISIFSLAKTIRGEGGIVTTRNIKLIKAVRKRAAAYLQHASPFLSTYLSLRLLVSDLLSSSASLRKGLTTLLSPLLCLLPNPHVNKGEERDFKHRGHRILIRREDFIGFEKRVALDQYDPYFKKGKPRYREVPCWYTLLKNLYLFRQFDKRSPFYRKARIPMDKYLQLEKFNLPQDASPCYFKVPFFTKDREKHIVALAALGIAVNHIYDPPLPVSLPPEFYISCMTDEVACLRWSESVLPVFPQDVEKVSAYFRERESVDKI